MTLMCSLFSCNAEAEAIFFGFSLCSDHVTLAAEFPPHGWGKCTPAEFLTWWTATTEEELGMNEITEFTTCAYCNADVPDEGETVPDVKDDDEWARLANLHADGCEWVETRAHRINVA